MTERERREASGERQMFSAYREPGGRVIYSFTPSALQFWVALLLSLFTFFSVLRTVVFLDLRPTVAKWIREDFKPELDEHKVFAKKAELESLAYNMRREKRDSDESLAQIRVELQYVRARVDAIADKVKAPK